MEIKSIKGTSDIIPPQIYFWQKIENEARRVFESFGHSEIRTPIFEDTNLFIKSIGDTTDIVQKEMYTFVDRGERSITLRPEGTAPIVRAYIEHNLNNLVGLCKFYYIGPMFRAERPQKGRSRQFYQIGLETIGSKSPYADIDSILAMVTFFRKIGLNDYEIKLNSIGCKEDKKKFGEILKNYLEPKKPMLCDDCKARLEKNVLRILDCKNEACKLVIKESPKISDKLCSGCKNHFEIVIKNLEKLNIPFKLSPNLVRGLDYYTGTVFEVSHKNLGAQDALGAGGRYDNLVRDLGGPADTGSFGFALGLERLIIALNASEENPVLDIFIAPLGESATSEGLKILKELRNISISSEKEILIKSEMDFEKKSLNAKMRQANKRGAKFVIIINDEDLKEKKSLILRDMMNKTQDEISINNIIEDIILKFKRP